MALSSAWSPGLESQLRVALFWRAVGPAKGARSHAVLLPEGVHEMALVRIAEGQRQLGQGAVGVFQLLTRALRAQAAHMIADRATVMAAKGPRQVSGMHSGRRSDRAQGQVFA